MPYIKKGKRQEILSKDGDHIRIHEIETAGDLNFAITHLVKQFLYYKTDMLEIPLKYQLLNDIVGALDGAKIEFQRRVVAPYEDRKIEENGDVRPIIEEEEDEQGIDPRYLD